LREGFVHLGHFELIEVIVLEVYNESIDIFKPFDYIDQSLKVIEPVLGVESGSIRTRPQHPMEAEAQH
jgi:hypothetical protein